MSSSLPKSKHCRSCGLSFNWRKKWEDNWSEVFYCSDACRKKRVSQKRRMLRFLVYSYFLQQKVDHQATLSQVHRYLLESDVEVGEAVLKREIRELMTIHCLHIDEEKKPMTLSRGSQFEKRQFAVAELE